MTQLRSRLGVGLGHRSFGAQLVQCPIRIRCSYFHWFLCLTFPDQAVQSNLRTCSGCHPPTTWQCMDLLELQVYSGESDGNTHSILRYMRLRLLHRARWQHPGCGTRGVGYYAAGFPWRPLRRMLITRLHRVPALSDRFDNL